MSIPFAAVQHEDPPRSRHFGRYRVGRMANLRRLSEKRMESWSGKSGGNKKDEGRVSWAWIQMEKCGVRSSFCLGHRYGIRGMTPSWFGKLNPFVPRGFTQRSQTKSRRAVGNEMIPVRIQGPSPPTTRLTLMGLQP